MRRPGTGLCSARQSPSYRRSRHRAQSTAPLRRVDARRPPYPVYALSPRTAPRLRASSSDSPSRRWDSLNRGLSPRSPFPLLLSTVSFARLASPHGSQQQALCPAHAPSSVPFSGCAPMRPSIAAAAGRHIGPLDLPSRNGLPWLLLGSRYPCPVAALPLATPPSRSSFLKVRKRIPPRRQSVFPIAPRELSPFAELPARYRQNRECSKTEWHLIPAERRIPDAAWRSIVVREGSRYRTRGG